MRVAIIHYHLARGGVTRVIQSALRALQGTDWEPLVLSSAPPEESLEPVALIPELAYRETASREGADQLERNLLKAAREHFGRLPDVWHFHNHGLGKNANLPEVVRRLAVRGERLVLQIHDFAEDGRPDNFRVRSTPYQDGTFADAATALYPVAPQIIYALLNQRDARILEKAGIPQDQLYGLPNAISLPAIGARIKGAPAQRDLILYPTRGIRRKNIGELLLMAALHPEYRYATTLAPRNPQWGPVHEHWEQLATRLGLPVELALCDRTSAPFESLLQGARLLVTTSIAEGFGLAFLEPSLLGKPLIGRDLPEITADFRANGVALPGLYGEWPVALDLFNGPALRDRFCQGFLALNHSYGRLIGKENATAVWTTLAMNGTIDFGSLDETAQTEVIEAVRHGKDHGLEAPFSFNGPGSGHLEHNRERIESCYGLSAYRRALCTLYDRATRATATAPEGIDDARILDGFLHPNRFRLLRA